MLVPMTEHGFYSDFFSLGDQFRESDDLRRIAWGHVRKFSLIFMVICS